MEFINFPTPTQFVASTSEWSIPFFNAFKSPMMFAVGVTIGVGVVGFIIYVVGKAIFGTNH